MTKLEELCAAANSRQVGGDHYKTEYQHWDFSWDLGLDGITHTGTKYLCRWRKKGGIEDLEKTVHYFDKLIELSKGMLQPRPLRYSAIEPHFCMQVYWKLIRAYQISPREAEILYWFCFWTHISGLENGRGLLLELIDDEKKLLVSVPVEDSNKHAIENRHY